MNSNQKKSKSIPCVYITSIPFNHRSYFQWLVYGFYVLEKQGKIKLSFSKMILRDRLTHQSSKFQRFAEKHLKHQTSDSSYCLQGFMTINGKKKYFCYDIADSPFLFDINLLQKVDFYFKAQCPKEISTQGFPLSTQVYIPFHPDAISFKKKIYPAMIGPRCLYPGSIFQFSKMDEAYHKMIQDKNPEKDSLLMCYFGSALGPVPSANVLHPDYNSESDILGYFKEKVNHPNEKRAIAATFISQQGDLYDSRLINPGNSDSCNTRSERRDLIIPLSDFCKHVSRFKYNLNISGYRNSIPNRFIESFAVGTAILTDKLFVKWYLPFDKEVCESIEMNYLPMQNVDWKQFKDDLKNLPTVSQEEVLDAYDQKWSPLAFANYIVIQMKNDSCKQQC